MIYSISDPDMKSYIGGTGDDLYSGDMGASCSVCGAEIKSREEFYDVDGTFFCMNCEGHAEKKILDIVRDDFIFEM